MLKRIRKAWVSGTLYKRCCNSGKCGCCIGCKGTIYKSFYDFTQCQAGQCFSGPLQCSGCITGKTAKNEGVKIQLRQFSLPSTRQSLFVHFFPPFTCHQCVLSPCIRTDVSTFSSLNEGFSILHLASVANALLLRLSVKLLLMHLYIFAFLSMQMTINGNQGCPCYLQPTRYPTFTRIPRHPDPQRVRLYNVGHQVGIVTWWPVD